jgi:D-alanyl-D-alanine carboxypeptidase/D-alanyl-D-alanine-endopeptidase (penicillin-binding protein 4)
LILFYKKQKRSVPNQTVKKIMGVNMKFEKLFLISLGICGSFFLPLQAAEKLESLEVIWNYEEIQGNVVAFNKTKASKLIQQASRKFADDKLAKQRIIWKAKWDAEQRVKKQKLSNAANQNKTVATSAQQPQLNKNNNHSYFTAAELALATPKPKTLRNITKQATTKPLTRAQYQGRWKQAQLKKQQLAKANTPSFTNKNIQKYASKSVLPKQSHATFRQSKQKAILSSLPLSVKSKLNAAKINTRGMSAYVKAVNSPRPLLGHKEQTSRVPASVMKLITSYAALGTLGPNYRWPLDVLTNGVVRNGTLQGDLIIKGYGAPEFNQVELRKVLQGIKRKGVRNVSGRVVFDNSYFNVGKQPSIDGNSQSAYNAQPDALLYNERISSFQVRAKGKRVNVSTSTPTHNLKIVNRMKKTRRGCRPRIGVSHQGAQTVVTFRGRFSRRCGTRTYSRVISRPAEMIYGAMQAMWKRDVGGKLNTRFALGRAPANAKPLLRTYSRTLAEILPTIDKDSNNVMARQVMLTIGARVKGQGTQRAGANAIGDWLISRGLNFPELRIENGSGLSRHARISARHVGDLLVDAHRSPYRKILMQSLAIAGVDGTMKRRLKSTQVRGRAFFKTGTLRDVRSIAGYVKAADGKTYVMAILHNGPRAKSRALAAHDKLIQWVYSGG